MHPLRQLLHIQLLTLQVQPAGGDLAIIVYTPRSILTHPALESVQARVILRLHRLDLGQLSSRKKFPVIREMRTAVRQEGRPAALVILLILEADHQGGGKNTQHRMEPPSKVLLLLLYRDVKCTVL